VSDPLQRRSKKGRRNGRWAVTIAIGPTKVATLAAQSTISCVQLLEFESNRRV
jgi:hypothetical protein